MEDGTALKVVSQSTAGKSDTSLRRNAVCRCVSGKLLVSRLIISRIFYLITLAMDVIRYSNFSNMRSLAYESRAW